MNKFRIFLLFAAVVLLSFAVPAQSQTGYLSEDVLNGRDSTAVFKIGPTDTESQRDTSQVYQFVPGPEGYPGTQFPDIISHKIKYTSLNDSTNCSVQLQLSRDGSDFETYIGLDTTIVSGTGDTAVFLRHTNIPGFSYSRYIVVGDNLAAGDSVHVTVERSKEYH